jgi:hypothetical protein
MLRVQARRGRPRPSAVGASGSCSGPTGLEAGWGGAFLPRQRGHRSLGGGHGLSSQTPVASFHRVQDPSASRCHQVPAAQIGSAMPQQASAFGGGALKRSRAVLKPSGQVPRLPITGVMPRLRSELPFRVGMTLVSVCASWAAA